MNNKLVKEPTIRIAVVEEDPLRLVGLRSILEPVAQFQLTAMSLAEVAADDDAGIVLIGSHDQNNLLETMGTISALRPHVRAIVIGSGSDDDTVLRVLSCGAKGYVNETAPASQIIQAIQAVQYGSVWVSRRVLALFVERSGSVLMRSLRPARPSLTSRELQVLSMLAEGRSNREIGVPLGIEERTVKAHVSKLMRKVGVQNRIALTVHALSHSLVGAP
jgi:DNA-binding NarL/FixJ family response regulator